MKITNNTILVTGGGSGIGLSLARAFSRHGNTVIVCGRNPAKLEAVHKQDPDIITFVSDITNDHEQHNLINALVQKYPQLNMLVNNAGIQYNYDFTDGNDHRALIDEEANINFVAHMKLMDQLLPLFMKMQVAAIVNVSSALGVVPKQSAPIYCATKAAIHNFSKALRYQLEKTPIKVFEIIPTLVDTEMTKGRGKNKVSPDFLAAEVLRSIETDKYEIPIGKTRILFFLNRFVPTIAQRIARNV
jgi:short-subunit dehydrogenase involved in D-alanine esterification of teichoic acids